MNLKSVTRVATMSLVALSTATMAQAAPVQPVLIEMVYHHFPTKAHKAEFRKNLDVVLKDLKCEPLAGEKLKSYERPNNITTHSLGLNGTVGCKISRCDESETPSELVLTFYDDGVHSRKSMTQFELAQCGSRYRVIFRFAGENLIGSWANSRPDADAYRWEKEPGVSTQSFYDFQDTVVLEVEIGK